MEEANKIEDEQKGRETGVEEANKSDEPSESSRSDCLVVLTV